MNRWEYLSTPAFKSRYVLAAHYVRDCRWIVEVGGYKNCVAEFLADRPVRVYAVDPLLDIPESPLVYQRKCPVSLFDFEMVCQLETAKEKSIGLVMMGYEIEQEPDFQKVLEMAKCAKVVVVEYAQHHEPSRKGVTRLLESSGRVVDMTIGIDLNGNNLEMPVDGFPPFYKRVMHILR